MSGASPSLTYEQMVVPPVGIYHDERGTSAGGRPGHGRLGNERVIVYKAMSRIVMRSRRIQGPLDVRPRFAVAG